MACETQDSAFAGIHAEFVRQQAEIAKLRALVEAAYREGWYDAGVNGRDADKCWKTSESRAELG
jgi:hypothetical protein